MSLQQIYSITAKQEGFSHPHYGVYFKYVRKGGGGDGCGEGVRKDDSEGHRYLASQIWSVNMSNLITCNVSVVNGDLSPGRHSGFLTTTR